ncbi:hypothetical protein AAHE18_17G108900 [Arachis hypogaea]
MMMMMTMTMMMDKQGMAKERFVLLCQMSCSRGFSREGEGPIYYKVREVYFETSLSFSLSDSLTCLTEYCTQKDTSFPSI